MGGSSAKDRAATNLTEFLLIKKQDSASVHLIQASLAGQAATAIIDYTRADGSVYLELTMTETLISGYSVSGSGGKPTESISLNFTKVEFKNVGMGAGP